MEGSRTYIQGIQGRYVDTDIALLTCLMRVTGEGRSRGVLAFLISTAKDRGFSPMDYQKFATGIRKVFPGSAAEIIT